MAIYEYACLDCGEKFEALRSMNDADTPIACIQCESEHTSRQLTVFFAQSGGHEVAGGNSACTTCSSNSCATCNF